MVDTGNTRAEQTRRKAQEQFAAVKRRDAEARKIETAAEADSRRKISDAEAY